MSISWALAITVSTVVEAEIIAGRLRADGIPATILSQVDSTRGLTIGALAIAKIYVPAEQVTEAVELLSRGAADFEDMEDDEYE